MGLSFSDYFDDDIPYEQKPPEMLRPMEETDFPIQAKDLFAGLWEGNADSKIRFEDLFKSNPYHHVRKISQELEESDELHFDVGDYDYESSQAIGVFIIYPEFSVWFKRKGSQSQFFSDNTKLQELLNPYNGFKKSTHYAIRAILNNITKNPDNQTIIPPRNYATDHTIADIEEATGRIWGIQGKLYVSFWQDRGAIKPVWSKVEKIIRASGHDPRKALYLFGGTTTEDGINTYEEVTKGLNLRPSDPEAELRRKIHTNPDLKKAIIKLPPDRAQEYADRLGVTVAQLKSMTSIDEVQDAIPPEYGVNRDKSVNFNDADSIFIIYGGLVVAMQETPTKMIYFSNDARVQRALNIPDFQKFLPLGKNREFQLTHTHLGQLVKSAGHRAGYPLSYESSDEFRYGDVAGRVWKFHEETTESAVVGFWQTIEVVRSKWNQVKWALEKLGVDWRVAEYTFTDVIYKKFTANDIIGVTKNPTFDAKELEIKRQLHVSPQLKKAILQLPPNKLQKYADSTGVPVAKLKQLAVSGD